MSNELFTAEVMEMAVVKPPPRPDWFLVVAYWAPGGWWSMHVSKYLATEAEAREVAEKLPRGWTHYQIVRVPGSGEGGGVE